MDVTQAVKQRISTRAFTDQEISESEVREWLEAAQRALMRVGRRAAG